MLRRLVVSSLFVLLCWGCSACFTAEVGDGELRCDPRAKQPCPESMVCLVSGSGGQGHCFAESSAAAAGDSGGG